MLKKNRRFGIVGLPEGNKDQNLEDGYFKDQWSSTALKYLPLPLQVPNFSASSSTGSYFFTPQVFVRYLRPMWLSEFDNRKIVI